jgi:L-serine/L-threonine ammonia-lyase
VTLEKISGVATSLGAKTVARQAFEFTGSHDIRSVVVSDREAISSCINFACDHRYMVEPACGASLAVAYFKQELLKNMKSVVVIVCGGIGVDPGIMQEWSTCV